LYSFADKDKFLWLIYLSWAFLGEFMELKKGVVVRSTGSWYSVRVDKGEFYDVRIKGKFRNKGIKTTNPIAVGDEVVFELRENGDGIINEILPRNNYIIRKSVNLSKQAHIIASNIDQALLLVTIASPSTSTGFIDRFLVTAEAYHIPVTIVFNKIDAYSQSELATLKEWRGVYEKIGYNCLEISAINKDGVAEVKALMKDQTTLLSGHSGVGKSTLVNAIDASLNLKTASVSNSHNKGKHTTTFAEMFELEMGGFLIDTPGIKGFGLVEFDRADLSHYFIEFREFLHDCKFNNCQHVNEPKCAVINAVKKGEIAAFRYQNYLMMWNEDENEIYRTENY
jgi:ribosome biogenesis GTPase